MKKCKSCQSEIDDKAKKCPYCRSDQRSWFKKHKIITLILIIIFISAIFDGFSSSKNTPIVKTVEQNVEAEKINTELIKKQKEEISNLFCSERSEANVRSVNLTDFISMYEKNGETVTLHPANDIKPTQETCNKITDICFEWWNEKDCRNIAERKIWIGMDKHQLYLSWGLPDDTNNTTNSYGISSQFVYGDPIYNANYVYLEGKDENSMKVTSWQD